MKVDDLPAPGGLMQTVYILGKEELALAFGFQSGQRMVRIVGLGLSEPSPADHASRPVPLARPFLGNECLEANGLRSFPVAVVVAIVWNARVRTAAGARQDKQPLMLFDKGRECRISHAERHVIGLCPRCQCRTG